MPEPREEGAASPAGDVPSEGAEGVPQAPSSGGHGTGWVFYGLGLSLQTVLWCLLFLAIIVAVAVGGHLTEFRYVGF